MIRALAILLVTLGTICQDVPQVTKATSQTTEPEPWQKLIGKPAPELSVENWINSQPIELSELKGKVVLIRWWLESCPFCQATAPALNEFYETYQDQGLVVIGMYHEKPKGRKITSKEVASFTEAKGFGFPIAVDYRWQTLHKFWPPQVAMNYTSVSFLVDREGIIRYIHPGGSYNSDSQPFDNPKWKEDYHHIKAEIEALL